MKINNRLILWMIGIIIGIGTVYYACIGVKKIARRYKAINVVKQELVSFDFDPSSYSYNVYKFDGDMDKFPLPMTERVQGSDLILGKTNLWVVYIHPPKGTKGLYPVGGQRWFVVDIDSNQILVRYGTR